MDGLVSVSHFLVADNVLAERNPPRLQPYQAFKTRKSLPEYRQAMETRDTGTVARWPLVPLYSPREHKRQFLSAKRMDS